MSEFFGQTTIYCVQTILLLCNCYVVTIYIPKCITKQPQQTQNTKKKMKTQNNEIKSDGLSTFCKTLPNCGRHKSNPVLLDAEVQFAMFAYDLTLMSVSHRGKLVSHVITRHATQFIMSFTSQGWFRSQFRRFD